MADYFINASSEETFAQTITEAMACGTPVISTPVGVAPDLITPFNGVVTDANADVDVDVDGKGSAFDADALAAGITESLATEYDSEAIRQYIIENYSYSKIAGEYINLYKRVLGYADSAD